MEQNQPNAVPKPVHEILSESSPRHPNNQTPNGRHPKHSNPRDFSKKRKHLPKQRSSAYFLQRNFITPIPIDETIVIIIRKSTDISTKSRL